MSLNLPALFAGPSGAVKMVAFFLLFLVVRGTPALVGAAVLSTLVYPMLGLRLRGDPLGVTADPDIMAAEA